MLRYVILKHEMPPDAKRATHWDLMLEAGDVLRTWALPSEPTATLECRAEQLADHRTDYLEYEGPVSGGRGAVARWDAGTYRVEQESEGLLQIVLDGRRLRGTLTVEREEPPSASVHFWRVAFSAAPTRG